jgi:hypothetical protein
MDGWMGRLYHTARTVYDVSPLRLVGVRVQEVEFVLRVNDIVPHASADGDDDDEGVDGDHDEGVDGDHDAADGDDTTRGNGDDAGGMVGGHGHAVSHCIVVANLFSTSAFVSSPSPMVLLRWNRSIINCTCSQ